MLLRQDSRPSRWQEIDISGQAWAVISSAMSKHTLPARESKSTSMSNQPAFCPLQDSPCHSGWECQRIKRLQESAHRDLPGHPLPCSSSTPVNRGSWGVALLSSSLDWIICCATEVCVIYLLLLMMTVPDLCNQAPDNASLSPWGHLHCWALAPAAPAAATTTTGPGGCPWYFSTSKLSITSTQVWDQIHIKIRGGSRAIFWWGIWK